MKVTDAGHVTVVVDGALVMSKVLVSLLPSRVAVSAKVAVAVTVPTAVWAPA